MVASSIAALLSRWFVHQEVVGTQKEAKRRWIRHVIGLSNVLINDEVAAGKL